VEVCKSMHLSAVNVEIGETYYVYKGIHVSLHIVSEKTGCRETKRQSILLVIFLYAAVCHGLCGTIMTH